MGEKNGAAHLIKVKGEFSPKWAEDKLEEYVRKKIKEEIDDYYSPGSVDGAAVLNLTSKPPRKPLPLSSPSPPSSHQ